MFDTLTAFLAGMMMPAQAAINAQLGRALQSPVMAAFVSFLVGTLCLFVWVICQKTSWPSLNSWMGMPPRLFLGGLIGALFVALITILIPRLGAANMVAFVLGGQICSSLLLDHFGLLELPQRTLSPLRAFGAVLVLGGIYLIRRF